MNVSPSSLDRFVAAHRALDGVALNGSNDRVHTLRSDALAHAQRLGLPNRKSEAWKYTAIEKTLERDYALASDAPSTLPTSAQVDAALLPGLDADVLVVVDGRFQADLSRVGDLPSGAYAGGIKGAAAAHPELIDAHLGTYARPDDQVFAALNTAFLDDGAFVYVPKGKLLERPIHVVSFFSASEDRMVQPRLLAVCEDGASATLLDTSVVTGEGKLFVNYVGEFYVGSKANLTHYRVQDEGPNVTEVATFDAHQESGSEFTTLTVGLSGETLRNNVRVVSGGDHTDSHMNGLFLLDGRSHADNATFMDHASPDCESNELYKHVLWDAATGVFNGKILVRPDSQRINAYQSSRAILLGDDSTMNSKPELEIYADDVQCSHGAATGRLDDDALFYLRARGLTLQNARALLLLAFAREVTDTITLQPFHDWIDEKLKARFAVG
jgi:Fe-S cluster assembly protein SufD